MNKKIIIGIICFIVIILAAASVVFYFVKTNNKSGAKPEAEKTNDEIIKEISFNGIHLGDKITEKMKSLILDGDFSYSYKDIQFSPYKTNKEVIGSLSFRTITNNSSIEVGIEDVKINYKNKRLTKESDFDEIFKEEKVKKIEDNKIDNKERYDVYYYGSEYYLTLYVIDGIIYNVEIRDNK